MTRFSELPPAPVHPLQSLVELGALWDYLATQVKPMHVVEIGSLYGGSLWYWLQLPTARTVTSVDLVHDTPEVHAARAQWETWNDNRLFVIEGDSHSPATAHEHDARVWAPIDFLFLDGDHTYEGVRADWHLWAPRVRSGGVVAFHDTVLNGTRDEPGIRQLVAELKHQWRLLSIEWFEPDGAGITAFVI